MLSDFFKFAITSIRHRPLRSWLTIIGIVIGVAAVISLISLGQGMQASITEQFEKWGTNKLIVMPGAGGGITGAMLATEKLTEKELNIVRRTKGVDIAAEVIFATTLVEFGEEAKQTFVIGLPTDETMGIITDMEGFEAEFGRDLKESDREKVTIGHLLAKKNGFFTKAVSLRDELEIKGEEFKVVGIIKEIGNPQDDSQIYMPLETAKEIFNKEDEVDSIFVQIEPGFKPIDVAEDIKKEIRDYRGEKEGKETFTVQTFEQLIEQVSTILGIISAVLIGIAGIALLVGGVGIMNTMYTSVLERTREIGIMKAIGATNSNIMNIFLVESGLFGLLGGIIGIIIGIGLAKGAEIYAAYAGYAMLKASITPTLILFGLAFSFGVGVLAGFLPARSAAKLKPADALRYE